MSIFEILNEPHFDFTDARWRSVYEQALSEIRQTNPDRIVIVGGIDWNSVNGLRRLRLPETDHNLIGSFHYYEPFPFTHQGAEWVAGSAQWLGTTWDGTEKERRAVQSALATAQNWSQRYNRPVFVSEFGAYSQADMGSRARWTQFVAAEAKRQRFSRGYWEFGAGFGVMHLATNQWISPLYDALAPRSLLNLDGVPGYHVEDVNLLSSSILTSSTDARFDVDGDGLLTPHDLDYWVYFSGHHWGDTDLNGIVDFIDFLVVSDGFGEPVSTWSEGDFNANGRVDFADFLRLSGNFEAPVGDMETVPEPRTGTWLGMVGLLAIRAVRSGRPGTNDNSPV